MHETLELVAANVALTLEFITVIAVVIGAVMAVVAVLRLGRQSLVSKEPIGPAIRAVWLDFAAWILIALEFALGADIVRTAIAPTWDEIGQLGVIALIRTGLGVFLERDIEGFSRFRTRKSE